MPTIHIRTQNPSQVVDVTHQVADLVADGEIEGGLCHVFVPHATAAIMLVELDGPRDRTIRVTLT
ncbi:MAG: YjbQ family protein [Candidatus Binatia bacterium]|nr:YjbQ family protein [Candidatus Binatia bacterium]